MGFWSDVKSKLGLAERKAHVLSDPAISELFGVRSTVSGVNVGGMSALHIPAVLQAVRLISESVGSLPVKLFREDGDNKEAARKHTAFKIVHRRANEWTGATTLRTDLTSDALIYGNGFARVVRYDDGRPFELVRLLPGTVSVIEDTLAAVPPIYPHLVEYGTADTDAQPYFWPALRLLRKRLQQRIDRAGRKAVRDAWNGKQQ
ncbi:phage portal protein [Neorhizobium alkalisoli]|uniref:phage portal protein n=1 Tax=Neorhizobium alkalisoli TaxID=528178 RepID=UPI00131A4272